MFLEKDIKTFKTLEAGGTNSVAAQEDNLRVIHNFCLFNIEGDTALGDFSYLCSPRVLGVER